MEVSIVQKNQQNFYVETVSKDGAINILIEKLIPNHLTTLPYVNTQRVLGRSKDLEEVTSLLKQSQKVVLVNGLGGIGKTTLAKVLLAEQKTKYQHIVWINVVNSLKEAFVFNAPLMDNLSIDLSQTPRNDNFIDTAFEITINRLQQLKGNNLLVIDNAQQDIGITQNIDLITLEDNWNVLVTSRQYLEGFEIYELGFLSKIDAIQLFYLHYTIEQNDKLVQEILEIVDYHTLAVEVIAKTSQFKKLQLNQIKNELEAKGLSFTDRAALKINYTKKQKTENIYTFILAAFEMADLSEYEQWVLMQFSVLPSLHIHFQDNQGEDILSFLQIIENQERDKFADTINSVRSKGWLNLEEQTDAFRMHQLLQEILREKLQPNVTTCQKLIEQLTQNIYTKHAENPTQYLKFLTYGEHLTKYINSENYDLLLLIYDIGEMHRRIIGFDSALSYHKKGLEIFNNIKHDDLSLKGNINSAIGLCLLGMKKFDEALVYQKEELKIFEQKGNQRDLAISYDNIGLTYQALKQYDKALEQHLIAFNIFNETLEENDFSLGQSYHNVALAYANASQFEEALEFNLKALELRKKYLDEWHPTIAQSYHNITHVYYGLNQIDNALEAVEKAYIMRKEIYPENHPYLLGTINVRKELKEYVKNQINEE